MKIHRFIYNFDAVVTKLRVHDQKLLKQLKNVLRLKNGSKVIFVDGKGNEAEARLITLKNNYAEFELLSHYKNLSEPDTRVTLYCSILKRENFELVVQKATEVGVKNIVPIISERTVKLNLRIDRLEKIIKEAAEQSGRGVVPILQKAQMLNSALETKDGGQILNLFFDPSGLALTSKFRGGFSKNVNIFIGPEGGWSDIEIAEAKDAGFNIVSLGKTILRAETAAIVASYLAVNLK